MTDEYNIKDLYVLRMHAEQRGSSIRDYLRKGRRLGLSDKQIIQTAYDSRSLEEATSIIERNNSRKKNLRRLVSTLTGIAAAYILNFGVNATIARSNLPDGFDMRQRTIAEQQGEIRIYEDDIRGLPVTEWRKFKLDEMNKEVESNILRQEKSLVNYRARMKRALNPFLHFV